jgi:glycosyltransferase involved in cell wall biosynthesis
MNDSKRLSVMHVAPAFPPEGRGGLERQVLDLATEQSSRHEVTVMAFRPDDGRESVVSESCGLFRLFRAKRNPLPDGDYSTRDLFVEEAFSEVVLATRPDVVHIHLSNLSSELIRLSRESSAVVVVSLHDYTTICPTDTLDTHGKLCLNPGRKCLPCVHPPLFSRRRALCYWRATNLVIALLAGCAGQATRMGRMLRQLETRKDRFFDGLRLADCVITPSRSARENYTSAGISRDMIRVVIPGIHPPGNDWRPRERNGVLKFGFIGGNRNKGLLVLLRAFACLPADSAELNVYGRPCYPFDTQSKVVDLMKRLGVVAHDGFLPDETDDVFGSFDVLVAPSLASETFGLVAAEAIVRGIPVIASNLGGFLETVEDGENGILYETGNCNSLARAMRRMIDEPDLVSRLGKCTAKIRTVKEQSLEVESIYAECIKKASAR